MKNTLAHMIAALLILIFLTTILTGCGRDARDTPDHADETASEQVFVPEFTSLSALASDLPNMRNIIIADNTLFFTTTSEPESDALFITTRIFALDLDELTLAYLPNYTAATPPPEAQGGGVYIEAMHVDADGNLWVAEGGRFVKFDFPFNFDLDEAEADEIWEHVSSRESSFNIRKLDSTGAELQSIDINHLSTPSGVFVVFSFHIDDDGNIFIGAFQSVFVLDADGELLFSLETDDFNFFGRLIRLSDGRTAAFYWNDARTAWTLRAIDVQNKAWGEDIALPLDVLNVFSGFDEYLAIISDSMNLSGIHADTGEILPIIDWADSIGMPAGLDNVTFFPDGRVLFTSTIFGNDGSFTPHTELITLNRTPRDELPEKITLTLATDLLFPEISSAIAEFNRTNALYQIEVNMIDLSRDTVIDNLSRLALEIITGGGPDIMNVVGLPFKQWAARGLFADLYEFIDADPTIKRDDILEVVLRSAETNGSLYQIFPSFSIYTMIGNPDVIGSEPSWTLDELITVLEANPQATRAFGPWVDGNFMLIMILIQHVDNFVNWETGIVDFDNDNFIGILEFAYELRKTFIRWDDDEFYLTGYTPGELKNMISSGEIIAGSFTIGNLYSPYIISRYFGDDFIFKGYPVDSGSGNLLHTFQSFAISSMSENQEGAWEFLRLLLSEEWQRRNTETIFPSNRRAFEDRLERARAREDFAHWETETIDLGLLPEDMSAYVDMTLALIDSAEGLSHVYDPLLEIIFEVLDDMFAGRITVQDAARIIQNRASIYVAEQS